MRKNLKITISVIVLFLVGGIGFYLLQMRNEESQNSIPCKIWMGEEGYDTEKEIIDSCDDTTFQILDHEYAKDIHFAYHKPMPNANNRTVRILESDPASFQLCECCGYAQDKNNVYLFGKVVPTSNSTDSRSYCH
ncbi:DKNYY domain-containing protein [Candidatus Gracilibacteria bacterium]|nr:DKNYY domain-containing protein [Candidatus Gracilibacteria bacterium]